MSRLYGSGEWMADTNQRLIEIIKNIQRIVECDNVRDYEKVSEVKRELRRAKVN